ncbi:MAG: glycosyltransferase [Saprospiraceae bacterium]
MSKADHIPDVVLYSFFPWRHEYPSTAHGLARALAKHTRVWYVSKPPTLKDALKNRSEIRTWRTAKINPVEGYTCTGKLGPSLFEVDLPPTLPINALKPGGFYNKLRVQVDRGLNNALSEALQAADVEDFIWINLYAPTQFIDLNLHCKPVARYYYSVDAIGQANYTGKHGVGAEKTQLRYSDAGFATSTHLAATLSAFAKTPHVLPNAMATEHYVDREIEVEPADLQKIPHPRLGYVGNLDGARIDFEALMVLAKARPELHQVYIGPWNAGDEMRKQFEAFPNIHLLGRKDQAACPAYLQHVDVGMIPFRVTELTAAIYPLKINEYLALGLPVISTSFSSDIEAFNATITLADSGSWSEKIDEALTANSLAEIKKRKEIASTNTWDARAAKFLQIVGLKDDRPKASSVC